MGTGKAKGDNRAVEAAQEAISSPLLEDVSISGAQGVLVNITGGPGMSLIEVDEATEIIHQAAGEDANVILGAVVDEELEDEIYVTVIATGFNRRGSSGVTSRPMKTLRPLEKIPTGAADLQKLDVPAYQRRGIEISVPPARAEEEVSRQKIDKADTEKPAFLRKIMD
jgi:cell division protein FtsZ